MNYESILVGVPLVALVLYCILFLILLGSRRNKINKYYSAYIISMIIWSLGAFLMRKNTWPSPLFWNKVLCLGLIAMPIVFYHFTLVLTESYKKRNILIAGYFSGIILILFNIFTETIIKEVNILEGGLVEYEIGFMAKVMAGWSFLYLILALINIVERIKAEAIPYIRVKYVIIGLILVIFGGMLNLDTRLGQYPIDILSNSINALLIAYSIYIHKFLEVKILVKKGIAYSVYKLGVTGLYILTIFMIEKLMSDVLKYDNMMATIVMALVLAFLFQPMKITLQKSIDRLFYKEKINQNVILKEFSDAIQKNICLESITHNLFNSIDKGLNPKNRILFLLNEIEERFEAVEVKKDSKLGKRGFKVENPIVQWLTNESNILKGSQIENMSYFTSLWREEKAEIQEEQVEFIVSLKHRGQVIGLLMLGEKKSEYPYSSEELNFLHTILNNAAVAIDSAKIYERLRREAVTDGLTKVHNHRYFHEYLSEYTANVKSEIYSIAMIDVDLFKLYNDLYGHSSGDKALRKIARVIKESVSGDVIVARYGGEEFAVLMKGVHGKKILEVAENIRCNIERSTFLNQNVNEFLTVSIGTATYPENGETYEEVLENADKALYVAKESGRNKCIQFTDVKSSYGGDGNLSSEIKDVYFSAIYALAATIDAKDHYTYGHSENVSKYAVKLGESIGLNEEKLDILKNAGLLHDIGKIGIAENILTKESALTDEEYDIMKKHVELSITIIKHIPHLIKVIPAIMSHHERYDGFGYPRRIKGDNIPIEGRCLCIVDAFDAMTTNRSYRKALTADEAIAELRKNRGTQFDPSLTDEFIKLYENGEIKIS